MNTMQNDILKWTDDINASPDVNTFNKINKVKEELMAKHKTYMEFVNSGKQQEYRTKVELHNIQRKDIANHMKSVDLDVEYHDQLRSSLNV